MDYKTLREEINRSMKAQDKVRLSILRQVLGDVDAYAKDNHIDEVPTDKVEEIARKVIKQTTETYEASVKAGTNQNRTETLQAQIHILTEMLPKMVDGEELEVLVKETIKETGATSMKDMGNIIKALSEKTGGNFDKSSASAIAKELFS